MTDQNRAKRVAEIAETWAAGNIEVEAGRLQRFEGLDPETAFRQAEQTIRAEATDKADRIRRWKRQRKTPDEVPF